MAVKKSIVRTESLSTDRVNGEFDEDLIVCPICSNILWKPITCKTCENSFCLKCIRLWLNEKPNKCPFNCIFEERKAPGILLKLLSKLKIDCSNKSNGCTLSIPYEALEKHQLQQCQFRLVQCSFCLKEMLFQDLDIHQKDVCEDIQSTCLKCSTIYYQKQGHTNLQCLQKQSEIIQEAIRASNENPQTITENFKKISQLYNRQLANEDYARRTLLNSSISDSAPSAPVEESLPSPSAPFEEPSSNSPESTREATAAANLIRPKESLRISTVNFSRIVGSKREGGYIPNGYAAFNWENAHYMNKDYAAAHYQFKGFLNAFTNSSTCVAFNGKGQSLSIYLPNSENKFGLHSFESISIYHEKLNISITGYRSNVAVYIKHVTLTNRYSQLIEIDWELIDRITFTPSRILQTLKGETFALIHLNFIL